MLRSYFRSSVGVGSGPSSVNGIDETASSAPSLASDRVIATRSLPLLANAAARQRPGRQWCDGRPRCFLLRRLRQHTRPPRTPPSSGRHTSCRAAPSCPTSAGCRAARAPPRPPKPPGPGTPGTRPASRLRPTAGTPPARSTTPPQPRPRTRRLSTAIEGATAFTGKPG